MKNCTVILQTRFPTYFNHRGPMQLGVRLHQLKHLPAQWQPPEISASVRLHCWQTLSMRPR